VVGAFSDAIEEATAGASGHTDLREMARKAVTESLATFAGGDLPNLFGPKAVDFAASPVLPLLENPGCQMQRPQKDGLQLVFASDLPGDVADGASEIGLKLA
jgi:hypothetical protein